MSWLITGGAGYIGAHVVAAMRGVGERLVVVDDLSTGDAGRVSDVPLVVGSVHDAALLDSVIHEHHVTGVVHVAAKKRVDESVADPLFYYRENVDGLRVVLDSATRAAVASFVFSSSAAVYGAPDVDLVTEDTRCIPVNPYGSTKLVGEQMVREVSAAIGLRYANLRYFNVAGAAFPGLADRGIANLVPMVFERLSRRNRPLVFGADYPTEDGTCVRDFIDVRDIASAHVAAARALAGGSQKALTANIGRGEGVSVARMIEVIRAVTGTEDEPWGEPEIRPRRAGDPARVVASADRIRRELGWRAEHGIEDMVASAWAGWQAVETR